MHALQMLKKVIILYLTFFNKRAPPLGEDGQLTSIYELWKVLITLAKLFYKRNKHT